MVFSQDAAVLQVEPAAAATTSNAGEAAPIVSPPEPATAAVAVFAVDAPVAAATAPDEANATADASADTNAVSTSDAPTQIATAAATPAAAAVEESARPKPPPARAAIVARAQGEVDQSGVLLPSQALKLDQMKLLNRVFAERGAVPASSSSRKDAERVIRGEGGNGSGSARYCYTCICRQLQAITWRQPRPSGICDDPRVFAHAQNQIRFVGIDTVSQQKM
jgi:hypothetical protein